MNMLELGDLLNRGTRRLMAAETAIVNMGIIFACTSRVRREDGEGVEALPKDMDAGYHPADWDC
jgi:hypothetical protein